MTYTEFRDAIRDHLRSHPEGATWAELRDRLALPYQRPCPTWTANLEEELGLDRSERRGRALVWKLGAPAAGQGRT